MRILVTGGRGMLGRAVVAAAGRLGHDVLAPAGPLGIGVPPTVTLPINAPPSAATMDRYG